MPLLLKWLYPSVEWGKPTLENSIYLTFDDGPHPEITPWVMDELEKYGYKATFFCIGDNVRKYPETYQQILERGHLTGNHTFNHLKGFNTTNLAYFENTKACAQLVQSNLFRPPYGYLKPSQISHLQQKQNYKIIMFSIIAEDWNVNLDVFLKLDLLKRQTKPGDIVIFHDSEKAKKNLEILLPAYLEHLNEKDFKSFLF